MSASVTTGRFSRRSRGASSRTASRCCTLSGNGEGAGTNNPWINKYIFPGAYTPALSEVTPHIEKSGLLTTDIEVLRLHYAETLRHWRWRFAANRDAIAALYDERFCRMWEFYLSSCELAFRSGLLNNFQIQLAHQQTAVPLTRDYITEADGQFAGPQQRGPDWSSWEQDRARGIPRARPDWR